MIPACRLLFRTALPLVIALIGAAPVLAADTRSLGEFADWRTFAFQEKGGKVCYMAARPMKAEGNFASRGDIHVLITHRPKDKTFNVVSVVAGYAYKDGVDVDVAIAKRTFKLFTQGERAWARDAKTDQALVEAIRKGGADMVIRGTSARNTETIDTYSLRGAARALDTINAECGVKQE